MAFLSEGVESPCPRGVMKILVFDRELKKIVRGGDIVEKMSEGVKSLKKMSMGGKIDEKKSGGKMGEKSCPRRGKIDKKCLRG